LRGMQRLCDGREVEALSNRLPDAAQLLESHEVGSSSWLRSVGFWMRQLASQRLFCTLLARMAHKDSDGHFATSARCG
jgi:hypothetical protein